MNCLRKTRFELLVADQIPIGDYRSIVVSLVEFALVRALIDDLLVTLLNSDRPVTVKNAT